MNKQFNFFVKFQFKDENKKNMLAPIIDVGKKVLAGNSDYT